MATLYNSDLTTEMRDVGKIQISRDAIPNQMADKVVPVIDVNPKHARITNIAKCTTQTAYGDVTLYTTPTNKDFFLTGFTINYQKDVVSDNAALDLYVTIGGAVTKIFGFKPITLTVGQESATYTFLNPMKLDKGTTITFTGAGTVGVLGRGASIYGYLVENINA